MRILLVPLLLALAACGAADPPQARRATPDMIASLPAMKSFGAARVTRPARSNAEIARDFLDLSFMLESGRTLPVLTRFEEPISVRVTGPRPANLDTDLSRLLARIRSEAGITITRVPAEADANITIEIVPRAKLQRTVPEAACFVVPRVTSWDGFLRNRRSGQIDWATLERRERLAIFIPGDVPPQEVRDCLHEELAQSLGPLNDLYRLTDSVFNDDNFHTVLTGFDMLILRATYAPEIRSGMTREQVAAVLPRVLNRLNPRGAGVRAQPRGATSRAWIDQIETALGPRTRMPNRRAAARRAVGIAQEAGWRDNRLAFSLFALGRLSLATDADLALGSFLQAAGIYGSDPTTRIHGAHIAMQLAAFALSSGQPGAAISIVDANTDAVIAAENASLLSTLLLVKSEALAQLNRPAEAARLRAEALGWARYGYGDADEVLRRADEISSIVPQTESRS
ncbi:hypothetical protein PARPLA_03228 [Rhodobacteraceae bacterium THAF1]|uniref:DUF2927 domain-containing protein n=1 Tax=Palleronia sp. THAF1 TaxID=2587842 RepID=UPI000F3E9342|nr:hypothetical protein FIU81_08095 [Palleronia sp. THAF1]VDC30760.1 hypothetical protein PARPLA_03228 [Rhodobacteraceae bacterium THAF1]